MAAPHDPATHMPCAPLPRIGPCSMDAILDYADCLRRGKGDRNGGERQPSLVVPEDEDADGYELSDSEDGDGRCAIVCAV